MCVDAKVNTCTESTCVCFSLKQNDVQSARTKSTHEGVNQHSTVVTKTQQQRPESPTVTLTWHVSKCRGCTSGGVYVPCIYSHAR